MKDARKTKAQLVAELGVLRARLKALETAREGPDDGAEALRENDTPCRAAVETQGELVCRMLPDGTLTFVNNAICRFLGERREDVIGKSFYPYLESDDRREVRARLQSLTPRAPLVTNEERVVLPDGTIRWLQWHNQGIFNEHDGLVEIQAVGWDVTDRKRAEQALKEQESLLRSVFDAIHDGISVHSRDLTILNVNRWIEERYGDRTPLIGSKCHEVFQRRSSICPDCPALRTLESGVSHTVMVPYPCADAPTGWLEISSHPVKDAEGRVTGVIEHVKDITDQRQMEEALRKSERRHRTLVENAPIVCFTFDRVGRVLTWNRAAEQVYGYTRNEAVGASIYDLIVTPGTKAATDRVIEGVFAGASAIGTEWRDRDKAGEVGWRMGNTFPLFAADGSVLCGVNMNMDITERKRAEEALLESETRYRTLFEAAGDAIFLMECRGEEARVTDCNPRALDMFQATREEMIGSTMLDHSPTTQPDGTSSEAAALKGLRSVLAEGSQFFDWQHVRKDGEVFEAEVALNRIDLRGRTYVQGIVRDASRRKRAEAALRRSEASYRGVFDNATDAIFLHDPKTGAILDVNRRMCEMYRCTPAEAQQLNVGDLSANEPPYTQKEALRHIRAASVGQAQTFEWLARDRTGRRFWAEVHLKRATIGGEDRLLAFIRDVTERKQAKEALQESEERFRLLAENVPGVIYLRESDTTCPMLYLNDEVEALTGYPKEDFLENHVSFVDLCHPDDAPGIPDAVRQAVAEGEPFHLVYRIKHRSGQWRWINEVGAAVNPNDETVLLEGFLSDVTERKRAEGERRRLEAQIQHTQKLESLGVLAGGIAHDFNNLLVGILGNASLALMDLPDESPARYSLEQIETAAQRAADLTNQMLAYSGKGRFVVQPLHLSRLVEEMTHLLEASISKKVVLKYAFAEALPAVEADATQIRQVIMNLITNASEAIGNKSGTVTVSTGLVQADRAYLSETYLNEELPEGSYVYLEVADTGTGMDSATRARIFDPFFTTKFTGRGLGLAAVLGIVRGHRGAIKIYSEPGHGTTFRVLLPCTDRVPDDAAQDTGRFERWLGSGTVLVVDDEASVRQVARQILERAGFTIITAENGRQAIERFREDADDVAAVLLDMTMPDMNGEETFRELRRIRSDARIILSSGYSQQEITSRFAGKGLAGFVQKPYLATTLLTKLRQALEG